MDLQTLIDRQAIVDLLHRLGRGIDRNLGAIVRDSFAQDATLSLGYYQGDLAGYLERFEAIARAPDPPLSHVQHRIGNVHVEVDGDRAGAETYYDVCSRRKLEDGTQRDELVAARALDRFVRREDRWLISERTLVWDWGISVPAGPSPWANSDSHIEGRRGTDDPSDSFWADFHAD